MVHIEACCNMWEGYAQTLFSLDAAKKVLCSLVDELYNTLKPLSHRRVISSLSLLYFHGRCSDEVP